MDELTTETITLAQIKTLRAEAAEAGDTAQVTLCERAELAVYDPDRTWNPAPFDGPDAVQALEAVVDAINEARAQSE